MAKPKLDQIIAAGLFLSLVAGIVGCSSEPPVPPEVRQQSDQLSEIRTRTGFNWDKATEADKKFLRDTCGGNEGCAKQLLFRPPQGGPGRRLIPGGGAPPPPPAGGG